MRLINEENPLLRIASRTVCVILCVILVACAVLGVYAAAIPSTVSCFLGEDVPSYLGATLDLDDEGINDGSIVQLSHGQYKLFGAIPVRSVTIAKLEDVKLYVAGIPFGLKFLTKGVVIVGFENEESNPAFRAGLRLYDTLTKVNGREITSSGDLLREIEACGGKEIEVTYLRSGREASIKFKPTYSESEKRYTVGIWLKDSGAGIGTVTYVLPDGTFGGLGHGICDNETGELTQISNGSVLGVTVNGIIKGQKGNPGELKGYFNSSKVGSILQNTDCGVFGVLAAIPEAVAEKSYSIGLKGDLKEGEATLICTLGDNVRREYTVEISNINRGATGNKCFTVKITDSRLIAATGGIVQGMSGSPIIQNGKLVGAVTHVLVNDPTTGYGIFIENMLANNSIVTQQAA